MIMDDKNGKEIKLEDYVAETVVSVQISDDGRRLWVNIDGVAVLRVKAPQVVLNDQRKYPNADT